MNEVGDPDPRVGADGGVLADVVDLTPYLADLWVTSDHHFGHVNIIRYCGRPFAGEPGQSLELARRWRDCVPWEAPLLHLGDLVMGPQDPAADPRAPGKPAVAGARQSRQGGATRWHPRRRVSDHPAAISRLPGLRGLPDA